MAGRILLLTPRFYGIEKLIISALEELHFEVVWFENKTLALDFHGTKSKLKFLRRIWFLLFSPVKRYLRKEFRKIDDLKFDIFLSINAHVICSYLFRKLKRTNPDLYSVLYLWDSSAKYDWSSEFRLFTKVITFDQADSVKYKIEYKPNFYIKNCEINTSGNKYDLLFVGKFTPERLVVAEKIVYLSSTTGIVSFIRLWPAYKVLFHNILIYNILKKIKLHSTWLNHYLLNFEAKEGILKKDYIIKDSLKYNEIQQHSENSNVILDIPFEGQSGYTHRLIDALANGKKIITTNSNIRIEPFYNPEQIHIIETSNPQFDAEWMRKKSVFNADSSFEKLELSEWLKSVIYAEIS
jgi:hypothetical protein